MSEKFLAEEKCIDCHKTTLWSDINFDHKKTNFALSGKHADLTCSKCHYPQSENKVTQIFKDLSSSCESCHKDIHFNQFRIDGETQCERCHGFNNWKPEKFDHSNTKFPLDGAHSKVKCEACHKEMETPVGKFIKYKIEETKCIDCHS